MANDMIGTIRYKSMANDMIGTFRYKHPDVPDAVTREQLEAHMQVWLAESELDARDYEFVYVDKPNTLGYKAVRRVKGAGKQ